MKTRKIKIIGASGILLCDDLDLVSPIQVFEQHLDDDFPKTYQEYKNYSNKQKHRILPHKTNQPLLDECRHFVDCIQQELIPISDAQSALRVVYTLEKAEESLKKQSKEVIFKIPTL